MSSEEPSAKKIKLSGSGNGAQPVKSETPENEEGNLFYFLGCNDGKENELTVLRTQKEFIIKKYNELKLNFNACKDENSKLKKEAQINSARLIAIASSWESVRQTNKQTNK